MERLYSALFVGNFGPDLDPCPFACGRRKPLSMIDFPSAVSSVGGLARRLEIMETMGRLWTSSASPAGEGATRTQQNRILVPTSFSPIA
jgi:hypothetical protein